MNAAFACSIPALATMNAALAAAKAPLALAKAAFAFAKPALAFAYALLDRCLESQTADLCRSYPSYNQCCP